MFVLVQDAAEAVTWVNRAAVRAELTPQHHELTAQRENLRALPRSLTGS